MQFPLSWLAEFLSGPIAADRLAHELTMAGLEVEALAPVAPPFSGIVVAQVDAVEAHPGADKLRVCRVSAGGAEALQIVCGAPNVAPGMKVPCALVGARLPGLDIKAAKLRGVDSYGMLCSARELGLSQDHGGLLALPADAPVGEDIRRYLALDDQIFTIKLTPNRADCLGVAGIAREVAALTGIALVPPRPYAAPVTHAASVPVRIDAPDLCGRFTGRIVRGVNARVPTPDWMVRRLERSGQRSISALVDISNYVMLEMNRPNHVFDADKIREGLEVRWARPGEQLLLLNGQTIDLAPDVGVIVDAGGVESMAGIMGGESTSCTPDTTRVYVEAAFWWPDAIQGRARRYSFVSEASHRFERGVDFEDTVAGVERVTQLILEICGGEAGPIDDHVLNLPSRAPITLRPARARRVLGIDLSDADIAGLLGRLGLPVARADDAFVVTPPSYRFDLALEIDLIEELARLYGYDNIPAAVPRAPQPMLPLPEARRGDARLKQILVGRDYQEVINYAFIERDWEADFCANTTPVTLANPIASQMAVMRSSLIPCLVATVAANRKRHLERVRVFEMGRCFKLDTNGVPVAGFDQPRRIAALAWGSQAAEQWGEAARKVDFFDLKGDLEALLAPARLSFERTTHPALHPGRAASVQLDGRRIGLLGEIHPQWVQKYDLGSAPVVFELDLDLIAASTVPAYREVSRFPAVRRDIALVVALEVPAATLQDCLRRAAPAIVAELEVFDQYHGAGIPQDRKSLAFRVVMQDTERTLEDKEADAAVAAMVRAAEQQFAAKLRV
ncbi:MAG: phenylalanine--tRNA ligase subunit beta [Rhodocyclaceae bacterium]|nr:phenylalanine--tRNA ligase subunit beta [Rhodocyclaceae bacterium]